VASARRTPLLLLRNRARTNPGPSPGFWVAAPYQMHEFLRRRYASAVAILLRHGATNPRGPERTVTVDSQLGKGVWSGRKLHPWPTGFPGRAFFPGRALADFGAVAAHDAILRLRVDANAQPPTKVAHCLKESACGGIGSSPVAGPALFIGERSRRLSRLSGRPNERRGLLKSLIFSKGHFVGR
jgi:hypothetical protein